MGIIRAAHLIYDYITRDDETGTETASRAIDDVDLDVDAGDFIAILGHNGSGKSTLAKHINALLTPTGGSIWVKDMDTKDENHTWDIRQSAGMVFQNPDNQIIGSIVEEDVGFGPENIGVPTDEIWQRVDQSLKAVGMTEYRTHSPNKLSGGQKQRVAIARSLAMDPKILLCDEATSALDPTTTRSILALLKEINQKYGITIVIITHEMGVVQEICSHVAIIDQGELAETGTVEKVFAGPRSKAAKKLVFQGERKYSLMKSKRCIRIVFTENSSFEPVIANMVLECKASVNILLADTQDVGGIARGQMVLQLPEDGQIADKMIQYLKDRNLAVEELDDYVE